MPRRVPSRDSQRKKPEKYSSQEKVNIRKKSWCRVHYCPSEQYDALGSTDLHGISVQCWIHWMWGMWCDCHSGDWLTPNISLFFLVNGMYSRIPWQRSELFSRRVSWFLEENKYAKRSTNFSPMNLVFLWIYAIIVIVIFAFIAIVVRDIGGFKDYSKYLPTVLKIYLASIIIIAIFWAYKISTHYTPPKKSRTPAEQVHF